MITHSQFEALLKLIDNVVEDKNFDTVRWLNIWLTTPIGALGFETPENSIKSGKIDKVEQLLACMQSGAYL